MKLPTPLNTSGGNPRSADRMLAASMCLTPLGAAFLEVHSASRDQRTTSLVERCFILHIDGDGSRRLGAVQIRSSMCEDGLAQEDDVVCRRGGIDGRETWHGRCNSTTLKMDWWEVATTASYPASVLVEECVGLVGAPYPARVLVGTSGLRCLGLAAMSVWYLDQTIRALHQLDRCSDSCCLDGGFSLAVIWLCKVL